MSGLEMFQTWAPGNRLWSQWAKPVLFAHCVAQTAPQSVDWPRLDAPNDRATALLIDLPRETAVDYGVAAGRDGYWPVPIFNCAFGPGAALNIQRLIDRLSAAMPELQQLAVPPEAPPAFLLDSRRMNPEAAILPGTFDNRYVVLPQDFPSAGFLKAHGISRAIWIFQQPGNALLGSKPSEDLQHVLRRWQEGGIELFGFNLDDRRTEPLSVPRPSLFRSLFYRASALAGLRRNSAGGFGAVVPQPSSGG